ncbi:MAG: response regulator GacA [Porticoccaceae bacterium]|nr:MAG: response regulator GacA [Porticoccaceae bacterium]
MISVLVVDDHPLVRIGLCSTLEEIPGVVVLGQAGSGEEALEQVRRLDPDVVLMDIRMPGMGGVEATRRLIASGSRSRVVIVTAVCDDVHPRRLLKAGVAGYITKDASAEEIATALEAVVGGGLYVSPRIAGSLLSWELAAQGAASPFARLSERELQVALMVASGHRTQDVARLLHLSAKTVATHKYRLYEKLGVHNDVELALLAVKHGLVDPKEVV